MKKIFTLATMLVLALSVSAQGYRKWDFTNWSAETVANLMADAAASSTSGWSDIEKEKDAGEGKVAPEATAGKCFWYQSTDDGELKANGQPIQELLGLFFNSSYGSKRSLAIAVDYPSTSLGEYAGPKYLWLGGGGKNVVCFTIPKVRIGQKMTFVVESHKPSDPRGIELYVGGIAAENKIGDSFKPTAIETNTWEEGWPLPEGATDEDGDGLVDIIVYNTSGCHIYSIEIGDDTQKSKIAYIYQGTPDATQATVASMANYEVEAIDAATATKTAEELRAYDAVVVASNVTSEGWAATLKEALGWTPIVNTSYALYGLWGLGQAVADEMGIINVVNGSSLFAGVEAFEDPDQPGLSFVSLTGYYAIASLADYFANDQIAGLSLNEGSPVAAHIHNGGRNAYIYIPAGNESLTLNAIKAATNSKAQVSAAPKPTIKFEYGDMKTKVIITSTVPGAKIYYTIDGSEPTTANAYTEPFWVDSELTVKACAEGDGYTLGEVAEAKVPLYHQALQPAISVAQEGGAAIVTLTCASEGADIFYNYEASNDSTKSTKYTGPITIMKGRALSAFAGSAELVVSEVATQEITVENPIVFGEVIAHMDANKDEYYQKFYDSEDKPNSDSNSKVAYYFSWGKSKTAYPYYDTTVEPVSTTTDPETGDPINVYPKSAEEKYDFGNGWAIRSRGQIVVAEITIKPGKDVGNYTTYNPATVDEFEFSEDYPVTDFYVNLSEWNTSDPRSAMIYSTQKFKGPFAVISYISNGNSGTAPKVVFETGQDIDGDAVETEWVQFGDTCRFAVEGTTGQRLYQKFVRLYTGTDEAYLRTRIADGGSKAGFYDIYVVALDAENLSGIDEVAAGSKTAAAQEAVFNLNGVRLSSVRRGLNIVRNSDGTVRKVLVK